MSEIWWPARGRAYSPEFQDYLAKTEPPENVGALGDLFD